MSNSAIKVENLSKIYRLGEIGTGSIGQDADRWFKTKILGKEDPFLKIGEANDRANKGNSDIVYSLRDINFEIQQGDAVGIIGRNGAGKSTLLKILSRVTTPTTGKINIKGRVASLLEVGTGFHPELTGRENIYLNGAILGMRKREIDRKLEEIIDFSGVERYIDTPVKRYSSGMYVRLAFAVAAHLESEILIVDEVLAVGDAEFQKKCLGKMNSVSKGEGRTILFVSHNLNAISILCNSGILLGNGLINSLGDIDFVLDKYQSIGKSTRDNFNSSNRTGDGEIKIIDVLLISGHDTGVITSGSKLDVVLKYEATQIDLDANYEFALGVSDFMERPMFMMTNVYKKQSIKLQNRIGSVTISIPKLPLHLGNYTMNLAVRKDGDEKDFLEEAVSFSVELSDFFESQNAYHVGYAGFYTDFQITVK
jgi:lipopolysaccharide transport system ATP-binding protein